jgi:hypothetical protein
VQASAIGATASSASAIAIGGAGGVGSNGASAGTGAAVTLRSAVSGATQGDLLTLAQTAQAGDGGLADTGQSGAGGDAVSALKFDDTQNTTQSTLVDASVFSIGGNGGHGISVAGGAGGTAVTTGAITGADAVTIEASADGGNGGTSGSAASGPGGSASATVSGSGSNVGIAVNAAGGRGSTAGAATATGTAAGASGTDTATASAALPGGLVSSIATSASTPVTGTSVAQSEAGIGTSYAALPSSTGTVANIIGSPLAADVKTVLHGNPAAKEAFGRGSTIFALGQMAGAHTAGHVEEQTESSTEISIASADLATPGDLTIAFLSPQTSQESGIDGVNVAVVVDGAVVVAQSFTSEASAAAFFSDNVIDLGAITSLGAFQLNVEIDLGVSSNTPDAAFGGSFLLGQPPPAGTVQPLWNQPLAAGFGEPAAHLC